MTNDVNHAKNWDAYYENKEDGWDLGGPPFSLTELELLDLFEKRNFTLLSREKPEDSVKPRKGAEELFIFQKKI